MNKRCAWCLGENNETPLPTESHGICARHKAELLATLPIMEGECPECPETKRPDQVEFSLMMLASLCCIGAIVVAVAVLAGALAAVHRWGWL